MGGSQNVETQNSEFAGYCVYYLKLWLLITKHILKNRIITKTSRLRGRSRRPCKGSVTCAVICHVCHCQGKDTFDMSQNIFLLRHVEGDLLKRCPTCNGRFQCLWQFQPGFHPFFFPVWTTQNMRTRGVVWNWKWQHLFVLLTFNQRRLMYTLHCATSNNKAHLGCMVY